MPGATIPLVPLPPAKRIEPAPVPAVAAREPPNRPAAAVTPVETNRVDKPAPTIATAPPAKVEPAKVPQPPKSQAAVDPAAACGRDEQRLARLRSDPVPDEVARLQRELSCDKLRPQVQRLFESIATAPLASPVPAGGTPAKAIESPSTPPTAIAPPAARAEPAKLPPAKSQAALEPPSKPLAAPPPEDPALACSRDEQRLARLRSDPVPDEVARLQRELSCDKLRPQVQRLFESIATAPPASPAPADGTLAKAIEPLSTPTTAIAPPAARAEPAKLPPAKSQAALEPPSKPLAAPPPEDPALACSRDEQRLARLRSDPVPEEVARLQRELSCDKLRAQVQRLFESIATIPASVAPVLNPARKAEPPGGPATSTRTRAAPVSQEAACARDTERLARVRAEPTLDAIARFEKELGCEHIRPQLQRLRESVGQ